ncbi:tyrosine-type recombinase/integrase [Kribbella sp. NBC_01245]|uniref:tyrosine-type recombinase/integrase n=1 Tax=Kribbella sp. NBC_01245 TaxID=2903578 RepID=UPI002E2A131A|nr:tyrosine-type recombinase/integrase [Kribbella sp. NBC_01245]
MAGQSKQRGHVEPHGKKFRAVVSAGKDPLTGRRRFLKETWPTEKEAEVAKTRLLNQVDEQRHPRSKILVRTLIEKWFEVEDHEDSTSQRYAGLNAKYIEPTFGSVQAAKLDPELLETYYARLGRCRELCAGKRSAAGHQCRPLSSSSIRQIHFVLRGALDRGVRWKYLSVNAAALAEPPAANRTTPDPPSAAEAAAILNEAWKKPAWGTLLWLVMVTGCRRGELCAVRWSDVDLQRGKISIERSLRRDLSEKRTKSEQDRRLTLDPYTIKLLEAHRAASEEQCDALGIKLSPHAFVFSLEPDFSEPMKPDTVTQRYARLARRNNLRSTRFHSLRHYSATELLGSGVDLRTVSGRLGHASGATTLRFYAAWLEEADKNAASNIAEIMARPEPLKRTPRSPYELIATELRIAIERGDYPVGAQLPANEEIRAQYRVATGTVSRAIALLKDSGLIAGPRGKKPKVVATKARAPRDG